MLDEYIEQTQRLLQNPGAPTSLYSEADITDYINTGRGQLAAEGECIRALGTIDCVASQRNYSFSAINLGNSTLTGVDLTLHVRRILYGVGAGYRMVYPQSWEWFDLYCMNNPVPQDGEPKTWAQYEQGTKGSFYLDPPPVTTFSLQCDCVCLPVDLVDDSTVEAIPALWTDAVPYIAAYYALLASQTEARQGDANRMWERYEEFVSRARKFSNPSVNNSLYQQSKDPVQQAKLGIQGRSNAGGGGQ